MKKLLLAGLFLFAFPSFMTAQVTPTEDVDTVEQSSCVTISNNLRYRMRDASVNNEVSDLQDFLNMSGYLKSGPTGYFGLATFNAVKKFQSASGFSPTGYVGPLTRAKISALSCGESVTTTPVATPEISTPAIPTTTATSTTTTQATQTISTPATPTTTTTSTTTSLPTGCTSTSGFSSTTGKSCSTVSVAYATPFCAQPPMPKCPVGMFCIQAFPPLKTYTDYNVFLKEGAGYSYAGACSTTTTDTTTASTVATAVASTTTTAVATTPTVEFIGTPTLRLQYDSAGKESVLVGNIAFKINAGSADVMFSSDINYPTIPYVAAFNGCCSGSWAINGPTSINAGTTATYTGALTAPTKVMLAGSYKVSPSTLGYSVNGVWQNLDSSFFINARPSNSVTIIGETSPYIISKSLSVATDQTLYVYGNRFSQTNNTVAMNGVGGTLSASQASGVWTISIKPSDFGITAAGVYSLQVSTTEGASNMVNVNVTTATSTPAPTVEFIGTPTLRIQYDSAGKESMLVGNATVKVTAGSSPVVFTSTGVSGKSAIFSLYNSTRGQTSGNYAGNDSPVTIPAGTSTTFTTTISQTVKKLFAGSYTLMPAGFQYYADGAYLSISKSSLMNIRPSNAVIIIGETSPYINRAVFDASSGNISISGIRFFNATANTVTMNGVTKILPSANAAATLLSAVAKDFGIITSGVYSVQVSTSEGASNFVNVNVTVPTTTTSITVTSPNGGESLTVGQTRRITWNSSSVIDKVYLGYSFGVGSLNWIATNIPNTGYYDWNVNIGNTTNTQVKISITGYQTGTGSWSDQSDGFFTVGPATATTTQPTLAVVRSTNSPSGSLIVGTQKLAEFTLWASTSEDINVTSITIGNQSIDYGTSNIKLYDVSTQTQIWPTISSLKEGQAQFYGFNFVIPSGSSKTLSIYADIPSGAKGVNMGITAISAVGRNSGQTAIISGLPVYGNMLLAVSTQSSQLAGIIGAFSQVPAPAPVTTAPTWAYSWTRNLEVNSTYRDDVSALQTALTKEGVFSGEVTGGFYSQTYLAVKAFQAKYGIDSTGFVGPTTRAKLNELY